MANWSKCTNGILICVPAYGQQVTAQTMQSIYSLGQWLTANGVRNQLVWFSGADIVEVRNLFLTIWFDAKKEYSHMLFVDADMGFPPELVRDMLRFNKPLLGCLYAKRKAEPAIVGTVVKDDISTVVHGFIPAHDMGCGVMLISRAMVEHMIKTLPDLVDELPSVLAQASENFGIKRLIRAFDPIRDGNRRLSEDVSFCFRWKEYCGGEVWANVEHRISHVGPFDFAIRYGGILAARAQAEKVEAA